MNFLSSNIDLLVEVIRLAYIIGCALAFIMAFGKAYEHLCSKREMLNEGSQKYVRVPIHVYLWVWPVVAAAVIFWPIALVIIVLIVLHEHNLDIQAHRDQGA